MEKRVNAGLTPEEAKELGLPEKDYAPTRIEEKIVIYADKLSDTVSHPDGLASTDEQAEERFGKILKAHPGLSKGDRPLVRHLQRHEEIQNIMKGEA